MELPDLAYDDRGLIPCVVQDAATHEVLMMAWMSAESLALTLETGETVFWSRMVELRYDCDADTLLALVEPACPA